MLGSGAFDTIPVTRVRPKRVWDKYSDEYTAGSWEEADTAPIEGCLFAPGTTDEFPHVEIDQLHAWAMLYLPFGADLSSEDRVVAAGALWDVQGRRADWPGRLVSGSVVALKFVREEER